MATKVSAKLKKEIQQLHADGHANGHANGKSKNGSTTTKKKVTAKKTATTEADGVASKKATKTDISESYNKVKFHDGQQYTGMAIGRSHKWYYDKGEWRERKVTPDRWELTYSVTKRRAGKAPEGSGVPVGTAYHWFILSHQFVEKLNANDYTTHMVGLKFKLAHKRAIKDKWSVSDKTKHKKLIQILKDFIVELEQEPEKAIPVPIELDFKGKHYKGEGVPVISSCEDGVCKQLDITLNKKHIGIMKCTKDGWKLKELKSQALVNAIGQQLFQWYE
jgi:hypothetical protein